MQTTTASPLPAHKRACIALLTRPTVRPQDEDAGAVRYHFPLTKNAHEKLRRQALALGAEEELLHQVEAFFDTPENALLRRSTGGWWLRWREVEGKEEEGYWVLRMCEKMTPEGYISYVDLEDEPKILSLLADIVPEAKTAKSLFEMDSLEVYARLLTTRAHYRSSDPHLDLTVDCTLLSTKHYILQGTVRAKKRATLDAIRSTLVASDILLGEGAARSKVVEYVRRNNKPLYAKLLEWGVVTQEGCVEWPALEQPALVMSPTLFC